MSDIYVAWNGREYPWPPPTGWEQRSDGRYWPVDNTTSAPSTGTFGPQYGPASSATYALPGSLAPPDPEDRVGSRPLRRRSYAAVIAGVLCVALFGQFVEMDVLGFTVRQDEFVFNGDPVDEVIEDAPFGEERELSEASKNELFTIAECSNGPEGAILRGEARNPLDGERAYQVTAEFFVNGNRQLDGFADVTVPAGGAEPFTARSASPAQAGDVACAIGNVFRFVPK